MARMLSRARRVPPCPRDDDLATSNSRLLRRLQRHREAQAADRVSRQLGQLPSPFTDLSDCRHGCNGDHVVYGTVAATACDFTCHPELDYDPAAGARYDAALARLKAPHA